uniref:Putative u3 small nucleolar rna-associated protein 20 n=1 Tax=Anopheles marajoara TaxID=58244 RepID=A0A2M4B845_9DIPT
MKNRPLKHKASNNFQFKSFRDRIKEVDIRRSALYRLEFSEDRLSEQAGTLFHSTLKKWSVLNLSKEYAEYQRQFKDSNTLSLLLFNKNDIMAHLLNCLRKTSDAAVQPLLDLVVALAKDLRKEFYDYFASVFNVLASFLRSASADRVEWTLICLAHLFKALRAILRIHFTNTFDLLVPLLNESDAALHAVNFATECLGYLARDLKEKRTLIDMLLKFQKQSDSRSPVCGHLLFEILNGVQNKFHTTAKQTMQQYFDILQQLNQDDGDHFQEILTQTITDIVEYIHPEDIMIFWETVRNTLEHCIDVLSIQQIEVTSIGTSTSNDPNLIKYVTRILQLSGIALEYKDGKLLGNSASAAVSQLIRLLAFSPSNSEEFSEAIVSHIIILLRSKNIHLTHLEASRLTRNMLMLERRSLYERFISSTVHCSAFEMLIWPCFVKKLDDEFDDDRLLFLADLLLQKVPQSVNGLQLSEWKPYPVQVLSNGKLEVYINSMFGIDVLEVEHVLQQYELYLCALIVLPHLKCFKTKAKIAHDLSMFVLTLAHVIETAGTNVAEDKISSKIVQLIVVIVETIVHLNTIEKKIISDVLESLLGSITLNECLLLNSVHLLVVFIMDRWQCAATYQQFKRLQNCLSPLLSSFDRSIRHLSSDILAKFEHLTELSVGLGPLYKTIAKIESIEPLVHTYREQVLLFQDLAYNSQYFKKASNAAQSEEWTEITLRYMMSIFSVNFKLLWDPATTVIRSYVDIMTKHEHELFWRVFETMLTMAERKISYERPGQGYYIEMENLKDPDDTSKSILARVMPFLIRKQNIDYNNVRIQLLNMLRNCTSFCRTHGDRIVDSFFTFLNSTNIEKDDSEETTTLVFDAKRHKGSPHWQQILLCYLNMCSELDKELIQEKINQLYAVYKNFSSSRNEELQQAALNGIFVYGNSHLMLYKDLFARLTNDKTLSTALLSALEPFDEDTAEANSPNVNITEQHRPDVVQLILNVLDGKIVYNLGCRDDVSCGQHKSAILTFIGRLREKELECLLQRWFEQYLKLLKSTPLETVQCLMRENRCDTSHVVPTMTPNKVNTLLNLLASLQTEAGLWPQAKFSIRLMHLKIAFDALLIQMDHTIYKKYKSRALLDLVTLIDHYGQEYQWTEEEIEAIMLVHVWPNLENLPKDSIHSATPLLKLLFSCSRSERLYTVLEKPLCEFRPVAEKSFTPLSAMIALLKGSQTSSKVCHDIFTALAAMLDAEDNCCREYVGAAGKSTGRNRLLLPYVKDLLQFIRSSLQQKRTISFNLLVILQNLVDSHLIGSDQHGERVEDDRNLLLSLLFPILIKTVSSMHDEPAETQHETRQYLHRLHIIVKRLLVQINDPERYVKQLAYMLEMAKDLGSRKMLFDTFDVLATSNSRELQFIANVVRQMNAMDNRWIDQPDHSTRAGAFRAIDGMLIGTSDNCQQLTGRICIVFLSQACHVLRFEKELSARQIAFDYVCKILEYLCADANREISPSDRLHCIEKIVLKSVLDGLKKRRFDDVRNDAILLLGELSRKLGKISMHQECRVFRELWHFTGHAPEMGKEMDFFDNITHLQTHQHCKALKRFANKLLLLNKNDISSKLSPRTVVQFLLPIVSHYICNENYRTQTSIIDEATNSIVQMCRMLPWRSYQAVLLQYLRRLKYCWDYQKQLLKIVIGIMDAFHFNLLELATDSHETSVAITNALMNRKLEMNADITGHNVISTFTNAVHLDDADELKEDVSNEEDEHIENDVVFHQQQNDLVKTTTEIVDDITRNIVPNLLSSFNFATEYLQSVDGGKNRKFQTDKKARFAKQKEEIMKLPIAIAIVKLFMKLPPEQIEINLPKLIIKVIIFMKSRLKSVRAQARNTLAHITIELGPLYFSFILQNLLAMLTRGFQRHVLTFTVHTLIERAQKHLSNKTVMQDILQTVLHICMEDIFGQLIGLVRGTTIESGTSKRISAPESKSSRKPYQTLLILAQYAREEMLIDLFAPFCGVLLHYRTYQTLKKVQDAFRRIAIGIMSNETIQAESLLVFIYGMLSGDIFAQCLASSSNDINNLNILATKAEKPKQLLAQIPETDPTYIILSEPKRYGSTSINLEDCSGGERNDHVFVECGMQLLLNFIKRKHVEARHDRDQGKKFKQNINPIIPMLVQSLDSKDPKIICLSLNCLSALWSTQWPISQMEEQTAMEPIIQSIFAILHRYNTVAIDVNASNFSIVRASFKAIVALLKYFKSSNRFTDEQLRLLILYIEQDISVGGGRQMMALVLVRSLIARRENFPELHCLMEKIFEICIRSESASERSECRQIAVEYIMCYPVAKKVQSHLLFLTDQLQYAMPTGRQSAGQLLKELFQRLPKEAIEKQHVALFFALGVRLSNESDKDNRAIVAECIEKLLERLSVKRKGNLVVILQEMLADHLNKHRELAGQLLLRIIRSEATHSFINSWLPSAYPLLLANLMPQVDSARTIDSVEPGKFVKPVVTPFTTLLNADTSSDHLIIQTLHLFDELLRLDPALLTEELYCDMIDSLGYVSQALLASGHHWVRLGALRLLYRIMNSLDFNAIHEKIQTECEGTETDYLTSLQRTTAAHTSGKHFFYHAPLRNCKSLTLDLCAQLTPSSVLFDSHEDETAGLITQILFLVANILRFVPLKAANNKIDLYWLIRRVRYVIQTEITKSPKCYTLRKHALHWMTSIVSIIEQNTLERLAPSLLLPAVRELSILKNIASGPTDQQDVIAKSAVNKVATKLCKEIRIRLGSDAYDKIRTALEQSVMEKRIKRKVEIAREKISQPLRAARRKASKKMRCKDAKKKKIAKSIKH